MSRTELVRPGVFRENLRRDLHAANQMRSGTLIVTDVFQQDRVRRQCFVGAQSEGFGEGFGIIDGHFIFHVSEIPAPEAFGDSQGFGLRVPAHIEPSEIVEARGIDHKRVSLPMAGGITQPRGIEFADVLWKLAPIREDRSMRTVRRFMQHHDYSRCLDDLRQTSKIQERYTDRQTAREWTVFPELLDPLLSQ